MAAVELWIWFGWVQVSVMNVEPHLFLSFVSLAVDGKFDGHIVLTDMCAPKPIASKCQRMWMTTSEYARSPYFSTSEIVVAIDRK